VADDDRALIAHLLRRTSFGPLPGQVDALLPAGVPAAVESVLAATPPPLEPLPVLEGDGEYPNRWWIRRMANPGAGLVDKMVWFWHGHLTSAVDKVGNWPMMWTQHELLRQHALGNFRTLLQAITVDPAMLIYLDGDPSDFRNPNENYSRELMELFALGRGPYTEDDVRAGAIALSGWDVQWNPPAANFYPQHAPTSPVTFLGRSVMRANEVVDAVCDHPACPSWLAAKLYIFFCGGLPTVERRAELAELLATNDLEVLPVVENILRSPDFMAARLNRPRYPVEWVTAAFAAAGYTDVDWAFWVAVDMGQEPFCPPSVAGWPSGARWLSAAMAYLKARFAHDAPGLDEIRNAADPVQATIDRCSLFDLTTQTRAALDAAAAAIGPTRPRTRADILLGLALSSPEFALA
jgi:uncharacterized protein (DUF1800 family)